MRSDFILAATTSSSAVRSHFPPNNRQPKGERGTERGCVGEGLSLMRCQSIRTYFNQRRGGATEIRNVERGHLTSVSLGRMETPETVSIFCLSSFPSPLPTSCCCCCRLLPFSFPFPLVSAIAPSRNKICFCFQMH